MQSESQSPPVKVSTTSFSPTPSQNAISAEWFCDEKWSASNYIFVGTVKEIESPEKLAEEKKRGLKSRLSKFAVKNVIGFQIEKVFKGFENAPQIEVLNLQTADLPAIEFKLGEKYLLYPEAETINKNEILFYFLRPNSKTKIYTESTDTIAFLEKNSNRNISEEVLGSTAKDVILNGIVGSKATNLVKPLYPEDARKDKVSGSVQVYILVDESGQVIKAKAVCPFHPSFGKVSEQAALASGFAPVQVKGKAVPVKGILVYNFVP